MRKELPQPTIKEMNQRIESYTTVLNTAEENKRAIESSTFNKVPHLDLTTLVGEERVDALDALQEKHRKITEVTIPIFTRWKVEAEKYPQLRLETLQKKRERIQNAVSEGRLHPDELQRTDATIKDMERKIYGNKLPLEASFQTQPKPDSERQFTHLRLMYTTRYGEKERLLPLSEALDANDLLLLQGLTKNERSTTFLSSSHLKKEITEQGGKTSLIISQRIDKLRKWFKHNGIPPQIIEQAGTRRGTKYRITMTAKLESALPQEKEPETVNTAAVSSLQNESEKDQATPIFTKWDVASKSDGENSETVSSEKRNAVLPDTYPSYETTLEKLHPTIKEDLSSFMEVIGVVMEKDQRFTGEQLTNTFRGFSGHWTEIFLQKVAQKGLINLGTPKSKRNYHPSFTREDVLAIWYYDTHREIINNPNLKSNQLRRAIKETIDRYEQLEEDRENKNPSVN